MIARIRPREPSLVGLEVVSVHFGAAEKACLRIEVVMVPQDAEYSYSWTYTSCHVYSRQLLMTVVCMPPLPIWVRMR